jgi:CrcB protein
MTAMVPLTKSLWVAGGAALGANARYWLGAWVLSRFGSNFPWGTLLINVTGSMLIGLYLGLDERQGFPMSWRLFFAIGICGGYTTFSTFSWETLRLIQDGNLSKAFGYVLASSLLTVAACWAGFTLTKL